MANRKAMFVPIQHETLSNLDQCRKSIWDQLHSRMDQRQKEWEKEMEQLKKNFFSRTNTTDSVQHSSSNDVSNISDAESRRSACSRSSSCYDVTKSGGGAFRCGFDVSLFGPDEISVQTHGQRLVVRATHLETGQNKSICRAFNREIDIPVDVNPRTLQSTLNTDGMLYVEAVISSPPPYKYIQKARTSVDSLSDSPPDDSNSSSTETVCDDFFRVCVDIGQEVQPQDLKVEAVDQKLFVSIRTKIEIDGFRNINGEFIREFDLPDDVDPSTITASLTDDGKLILQSAETLSPISSDGTLPYFQ